MAILLWEFNTKPTEVNRKTLSDFSRLWTRTFKGKDQYKCRNVQGDTSRLPAALVQKGTGQINQDRFIHWILNMLVSLQIRIFWLLNAGSYKGRRAKDRTVWIGPT